MENRQVYIISDVHGCYDTLMALIKKLPDDAELIFVGDLIDRGPKSRDVIDFVRYNNLACVQGNHEVMMCDAIEDFVEYGAPLSMSDWVANGGNTVLDEYRNSDGTVDNGSLQEDYEFLLNLPLIHIDTTITDDKNRCLLVTHSTSGDIIDGYLNAVGIVERGVTDEITEHMMIDYKHQVSNGEMLMIWDRRVPTKIQEKYFNVFGHTPPDTFAFKRGVDCTNGCLTPENVVIDRIKGYADIDTGCVYRRPDLPMRGVMTALEFPSMRVIQQENIDEY